MEAILCKKNKIYMKQDTYAFFQKWDLNKFIYLLGQLVISVITANYFQLSMAQIILEF